ncbi:MAG: HNH endonuclease [Paludibacter sp.]|nr:HNH endonuclease [Paludibacter sp.]
MINSVEFDYDRFLCLTQDVPRCDFQIKVPPITKKIRVEIIERDNNICQLCGLEGKFGNEYWGIEGDLHIHHIIPNGPATVDNLITLCGHCHKAVHLVLYKDKKWKFRG